MALRVKNTSGSEGTWQGQTISAGEYYTIQESERPGWVDDDTVYADIANGNLTTNDGANDITNAKDGWNLLLKYQTLYYSDIDGKKLSVHPSYKPAGDVTSYAVWTGAGDDLSKSPLGLGEGDILDFHMSPQSGSPFVSQVVTIEVHFNPVHGRVWIHEGYLKFNNGGQGDYVDSDVVAYATPLQTFVDKILYVEDNWVKYAVGSPYPATHGWAGTPVLIPRTYSQDGDWDYDGTNLTPNLAGTGDYKISDIIQVVHRYINKIPCCGSTPYFSMTSDETTEVPAGYYLRINCHNISNTSWDASVLMEIYRERTFAP